MINIRYLTKLFLFFALVTSAYTKVLFIVDSEYYYDTSAGVDGSAKITQYETDVETIDNKSVDVIVFSVKKSGTVRERCKPVWDTLTARYAAAHGTSDPIEGAVLIGDIPEPEMFDDDRFNRGGEIYPVDYYYMDLWDTTSTVDTLYPTDTTVWLFPAYDDSGAGSIFDTVDTFYTFDVNYKNANGDEHMEIWVSRIYARTINLLRDSSFVYDSINDPGFLDNHEIISNYLDRVHERMTQRAKAPPRTMSFCGYYHDSITQITNIKRDIPFDSINPASSNYYVWKELTGPNLQSQLQAGPYGTVNMGAFKGIQFDSSNAQDWRYPAYRDDKRGYEWAGIFEHSFADAIGFGFVNATWSPLPTRVETGGYDKDGNDDGYYIGWNRNNLLLNRGSYLINIDYEIDDIQDTGTYNLYMWYNPDDTLDDHSWIAWGRNSKQHNRRMNQRSYYPPDDIDDCWQQINVLLEDSITPSGDTIPDCVWREHPIHLGMGNNIIIEFSACGGSENTQNDAAIADAIKLENISTGDSIIIDNDDSAYVNAHSLVRSYYSMRDDGGPSKVPFHILQACHINYYTFDDNLGLLFAMGHDGLISVGTSNSNHLVGEFVVFLGALGRGLNFGKAYLEMANNYSGGYGGGVHGIDKYILFGAGTLKAQAYKHYSDCMLLLINNADITTIESHFVEQNATINGMAGSSTTIYNNGALSITAGEDIVILPEFHAEYGSEMLLTIDPSLK